MFWIPCLHWFESFRPYCPFFHVFKATSLEKPGEWIASTTPLLDSHLTLPTQEGITSDTKRHLPSEIAQCPSQESFLLFLSLVPFPLPFLPPSSNPFFIKLYGFKWLLRAMCEMEAHWFNEFALQCWWMMASLVAQMVKQLPAMQEL